MLNEDLLAEYTLEYKRKQWNKYWRVIESVHAPWLDSYMKEFYRRGAYPIDHQALANYYEDKRDIAIAAFVAAYIIDDDANVLHTVERIHGILGEHPFLYFRNRDFVHCSNSRIMLLLDCLYNIRQHYGTVQNAVMDNMRTSSDLGEAIGRTLQSGNIHITANRCRQLAMRLATDEGMGLDVWQGFSPSFIYPPRDEVTEWYAKNCFPANSPFDFEDHVLILHQDKPYLVCYEAMMMNLMRQADADIVRRYLYSLVKVFFRCPTSLSKTKRGERDLKYLNKQPPVYDWDKQTLERNPLNPVNPAWTDYEEYKNSEAYQKTLAKRQAAREAKYKPKESDTNKV